MYGVFGLLAQGTCGRCGKRCTYRAYSTYGFWTHDETGHFISDEPERHDCNTYIERDPEKT